MESTPKRHSRREDDNYDTESQGEVDSLLRLQSNAPTIPVPTRRSKRSLMTPQKRTEQVNTDVEKWRETATEEDHRTRPLKRARMSDHTIVIATPSNQRKRELEPSLKDVRYVLREIRGHINSLPELQRTIEKTAALLKEAKEQTEVIQAEVEEAVCLRWFVEEDIMKKMKKDRFLTDGTTALGSQSVQGAAWRKWQTAQQELAEHSSAVE
ncbi:hypothetical protein E1B28_010151 [Marasmius oreades]|uniref:Uncharacterized protein n=1 Tax=Marasmius oreades TaxID=181124 RepID=A0A9P7USF0_9AGAR|nr:uncharacterized protein E1B28_010151 [Marasmius oreades]KAG7091096.1 hypothetical protein E1B28_010151 [Marasmius oreades]